MLYSVATVAAQMGPVSFSLNLCSYVSSSNHYVVCPGYRNSTGSMIRIPPFPRITKACAV